MPLHDAASHATRSYGWSADARLRGTAPTRGRAGASAFVVAALARPPCVRALARRARASQRVS
eukprot:6962407-Prymnesium_polylepis.1